MTPGGYARRPCEDGEESMAYKYSNAELDIFFGTSPLKNVIHVHYLNYIAHIVRRDNAHLTKRALSIKPDRSHAYSMWAKINFILEQNLSREDLIKKILNRSTFQQVLRQRFPHLRKKRARANSEALVANQTGSSSLRDGESIKPRLHERFLSRASDAIFFRFSLATLVTNFGDKLKAARIAYFKRPGPGCSKAD